MLLLLLPPSFFFWLRQKQCRASQRCRHHHHLYNTTDHRTKIITCTTHDHLIVFVFVLFILIFPIPSKQFEIKPNDCMFLCVCVCVETMHMLFSGVLVWLFHSKHKSFLRHPRFWWHHNLGLRVCYVYFIIHVHPSYRGLLYCISRVYAYMDVHCKLLYTHPFQYIFLCWSDRVLCDFFHTLSSFSSFVFGVVVIHKSFWFRNIIQGNKHKNGRLWSTYSNKKNSSSCQCHFLGQYKHMYT